MIETELSAISNADEQWKQISNFSRYWVSDLGHIYDTKLHRSVCTKVDYSGYILADLRDDDNNLKSKRVHRLVAEAFLSDWNAEWPWTVNHINGKKDDNRLVNLEMLTSSDNSKHYQTADCFAVARKVTRAIMSARMKEKCSDPSYVAEMSDRMKKVWQDPKNREMYVNCLHERHSDPAERKQISAKLKEVCSNPEYRKGMSARQKENWNDPQYRQAITSQNQDRIWVHDATTEKWVHQYELDSYLAIGYFRGRLTANTVLSTKGKVRISNGIHSKFVDPAQVESYLSQGWRLGCSNRQAVRCIQTGQIFDSVHECATLFQVSDDLIRAKCKGTTKISYKLKEFDFCFCNKDEDFS